MDFSIGELLFGVGGLLVGIGAIIAFLKLAQLADRLVEKGEQNEEEGS